MLLRCFRGARSVRGCTTVVAPLPPSEHIKQLADQILALNLLEAKQLSEHLKTTLGIKDPPMGAMLAMPQSAPTQAPAPVAPQSQDASPAEETPKEATKTQFDFKLEKFDPATKVKVIKEIRAMTGLPLAEAKEMSEKAPCVLKKNVAKEDAEKFKAIFEGIGCVIKIT
eukprot:NODE_5052_length_705_cov_21.306228_g4889_i0.p1 GENE.NODE_5052_length_705_cov_21.306228_g4889_i0~~NODE_5052_length_705_cov_21.306228_g4889_i0.p1  ORF type:complete len:186 (-),score=58.56 NODE_5052_length_705_cov_21.306228_g4889_i0:146-652(-)